MMDLGDDEHLCKYCQFYCDCGEKDKKDCLGCSDCCGDW